MINEKLLATSIMLVFGVDGHGHCLTQSVIADKVLKTMGYNSRVVAGYHAMVVPTRDTDHFLLHVDPKLLSKELSVMAPPYHNTGNWAHCWVETDDTIIDVNLHICAPKQYADAGEWEKSELLKGKVYYMPTRYDLDEEVSQRKVDMVVDFYNTYKSLLPIAMHAEEGMIFIKGDGSWMPLTNYKPVANIKPNTKAIVKDSNLLPLYESLL